MGERKEHLFFLEIRLCYVTWVAGQTVYTYLEKIPFNNKSLFSYKVRIDLYVIFSELEPRIIYITCTSCVLWQVD